MHHVFHAEHNRLVDQIKGVILGQAGADPAFVAQWLVPGANAADGVQDGEWNGERLFQAARFFTEMQYQHLVFEEFARRIQPNIDEFEANDAAIDPAIVAEFAHTVYRFGHSLLRETIDRVDANGNPVDADPATAGDQQLSLVDAFLNPLAYAERGVDGAAAGEIVRGATQQTANEIDEFLTGALRNNLLGLPLDLATINLTRGREAGIAPLNEVREQFFAETGDARLAPYANWAAFAANLKHPESLVNFVAAYGVHPLLESAETAEDKRAAAVAIVLGTQDDPATPEDEATAPDTDFLNGSGAFAGVETGLNDIDFWIGGLAERPLDAGGLLGSTFNFVFETQLENLQSGDRFYYLSRLEGSNFLNELEGTAFSEMVMRNTGATHLPFDVFDVPAFTIEAGDRTTLPTDSEGRPLVSNGRGVLRFLGDDHVVLGGTEKGDTLIAGGGDDTVWGDGGKDNLAGGAGDDSLIGGDGKDRLFGGDGDDYAEGGLGDDRLAGQAGSDLLVGLEGADRISAGQGEDEVFGGLGNDRIVGGGDADELLGNEGDDWLMGGAGDDFLVGDNNNPFTAPLPDIDTAVFAGRSNRYTITANADGSITIEDTRGAEGVDTLVHIERLQFADQTLNVSNPAAPAPIASQAAPSSMAQDALLLDPTDPEPAPEFTLREEAANSPLLG